MGKLAIFMAGLLFGAGVTLSGMVNPAKVLNFLDIAGPWDPTLLFVMGAALAVTFTGYRLIFRRKQPLFASSFTLPKPAGPDLRLVAGAALFGHAESFLFVLGMAAGMAGANLGLRRLQSSVAHGG